uniref:Zinc finger CCHC-type and RNA-binding motif-containing protein 1 n=1 Tax=Culex pipiens TaxID=7175 RepID=A0A8D8C8Y9_CULPI
MSSVASNPIRNTAYVSNLPFNLTNIDLRKIFEKYGSVVRVTVLRDPQTRQSKGVAFVLFGNAKDADQCCQAMNNVEMFGRTLRASIAKDNGKGAEFSQRREYPDKSRCYECGEKGHMSYKCPRNVLGDKSPPRKVRKKGEKRTQVGVAESAWDSDEESDRLRRIAEVREQEGGAAVKRIRYKKSAYFSDDEEVEED